MHTVVYATKYNSVDIYSGFWQMSMQVYCKTQLVELQFNKLQAIQAITEGCRVVVNSDATQLSNQILLNLGSNA